MALSNAEKQKRYRERKKAQTTPVPPGTVASVGEVAVPGEGGEEDGLQVEIKAEEAPKPSLKDRIIGKLQGGASTPPPVKKATTSRKKKDDNLLLTLGPTVFASFVATYSQQLITDPYKPCAPTQQEVAGMIGPLFDILARQIEITGKASQTTIDLINSIICAFMYGIRAYITYVDIKNSEAINNVTTEKINDSRTGATPNVVNGFNSAQNSVNGLGAYQNSFAGFSQHSDSLHADAEYAHTAETHVSGSQPTVDNGVTERRDLEAATVADMLKRDRGGRIRLGLLPPTI